MSGTRQGATKELFSMLTFGHGIRSVENGMRFDDLMGRTRDARDLYL